MSVWVGFTVEQLRQMKATTERRLDFEDMTETKRALMWFVLDSLSQELCVRAIALREL